jgi:putative ABC transport system permease protein
MRFGVRIDGTAPADGRSDRAYLRRATPGYFRAMGIPIVNGRPFASSDNNQGSPVAIVDRTFVDLHFQGADPLGRRIQMSNERVARTIVGVVGAVRQTRLESAADPHVYVPQAQNPSPAMTFVIRTGADPASFAAAVRERLRSVDPSQPIYNVRPADTLVAASVVSKKFNTSVLALFAALAGVLTLVGVYGLMASWVAESRKELGVRLALGAERRDVLSMVVGRGLRLTAAGIVLGAPLAVIASRSVRALLFEVAAGDAITFAVASALLLTIGLGGSYLPARRAVSINPVDSLRGD